MKKLLLITAMILFAVPAMADTIQQTGSNNHADQNSNNNTTNIGSGNTYNHSGNVTANGGSAHSNSSSYSGSSSHSTSKSKSSADNSGNSSNSYSSPRNPVSTAFAAPLVASEDTCSGSTSVGGQGVGFGLSLGSTWQDSDCVRRKDARELHNMGFKGASIALMCQNANVRKAMDAAGTPCAGGIAEASPSAGGNDEYHAAKTSVNASGVAISQSGVEYTYPTGARH